MQLSSDWIVWIGIASIAAVIAAGSLLRKRRTPARPAARRTASASRGPASLHFTCADCSDPFTHDRRTLGAWEKGARRFYCKACHAKWRGMHPPPAPSFPKANGSGSESPSPYRSGRPRTDGQAEPRTRQGRGPTPHVAARPAGTASGGGCLGVAVLLLALPASIAFVLARHV